MRCALGLSFWGEGVAFPKIKCYDIAKRDFQISTQMKPKQKVSSISHLQTIVCVFQKFKLK